jgi:exopolysaccharide production protein ExoZ
MPSEKIKSLQVMRFVAAAMVVAVHAIFFVSQLPPGPAPSAAHGDIGASGVDIFFVISGFVIYRSTLKRPPALSFLRKRFLRIAPFYYLASLTLLPISAFSGWPMPDGPTIAASLIFWPAWKHIAAPVNPVGWSLCFEMLFYVAVTIALFSRRAVPVLLLAFVAAWIGRVYFGWPVLRFLGNPIILDFLFGVLIAARWKPERVRPLWYGGSMLLLGFAGLYVFCLPTGQENASFVMDATESLPRVLHWGIPAALVVSGALALEPHLQRNWADRLVFLGDASYAVYLIHWPLLVLASWLLVFTGVRQTFWLAPPLFVIGIAAGVAAHRFIEVPLAHAMRNAKAKPAWRSNGDIVPS